MTITVGRRQEELPINVSKEEVDIILGDNTRLYFIDVKSHTGEASTENDIAFYESVYNRFNPEDNFDNSGYLVVGYPSDDFTSGILVRGTNTTWPREISSIVTDYELALIPQITKTDIIDKIKAKFDRAGIHYKVDIDSRTKVNKELYKPIQFIIDTITLEYDKGLPIKSISVEQLVDIDAGQWSEIVFNLEVNMNDENANTAWDTLLNTIQQRAEILLQENEITTLFDKIGIFFNWV